MITKKTRIVKDAKYWLRHYDEKKILWDTLLDKRRWPLYVILLAGVTVLRYFFEAA